MKLWHSGDIVSLVLHGPFLGVSKRRFSRSRFGTGSKSAAKLRRILVMGKRLGKDSCCTVSPTSILHQSSIFNGYPQAHHKMIVWNTC